MTPAASRSWGFALSGRGGPKAGLAAR